MKIAVGRKIRCLEATTPCQVFMPQEEQGAGPGRDATEGALFCLGLADLAAKAGATKSVF